MKKIVFIYFLVFTVASVTYAQDSLGYNLNVNRIPLSSLQPMLQIPNAVSGALGEAGTANVNDPLGFMLNVAKAIHIGKERKHLFGAYYAPHESQLIKQQNYFALNGISRISDNDVIFYQVFNFKNLSSELRDDNGKLIGTQSGNDFYAKAGLSKELGKGSSLGIGLGFFRSAQLSSIYRPVVGANIDIGYLKSWRYKIAESEGNFGYSNFGASISNIGGKVKFGDVKAGSFAPMRFRIGYSYVYQANEFLNNFILDISKDLIPTPRSDRNYMDMNSLSYLISSWGDAPNGFKEEMQELRFHVGYELNYKILAARLGYYYENVNKGDKKAITVGLGLNEIAVAKHNLRIDGSYAFRLGTGVTSLFKLGLIFELGKEKRTRETIKGMGTTY
jgi:hypothetical protein